MASAAKSVRSFVLLFLLREKEKVVKAHTGSLHLVTLTAEHLHPDSFISAIKTSTQQPKWPGNICSSAVWEPAIHNKKHAGNLETATVLVLILPRTSQVNPRSHLRYHAQFLHVIKGWAYRAILLPIFRELQSHCNCTSGLRKCICDGKNDLESPVADMETETEMCDSGCLAHRICHQITSNEACPAHSYIDTVITTNYTEVRSKSLFTHQKVVSLDNVCLHASFFFPLLGRKLPKPSLFPV